jgi:hypothetical protein
MKRSWPISKNGVRNPKSLGSPYDTCPSYLRARIRYIEKALEEKDGTDQELKLLRYGVIQNEEDKLGDICTIQTFEQLKDFPPLDFTELTRFNTWFALHPEKVAGKEVVTTSRYFPLTIKGTSVDVVNAIHRFISSDEHWQLERENEKEMNKLKAKAFRLKLKLLKYRKHDDQIDDL